MGLWERLRQGLDGLVEELVLDEKVRLDLEVGQRALSQGDLAEAVRRLSRATERDPQLARGWHLLGVALLRQGRPAEAATALQRADLLRGDQFATLVALARAHRDAGDVQQALTEGKRALQCRADTSLLGDLYGLLGEIYLERGEIDHAVRELRKAVAASKGKDLNLLTLLGRAHYLNGNLTMARQALERAAPSSPADPATLTLLVEVLLALGLPDEAQLAARRLAEDRPDDRAVRCLLARALLACGDPLAARDQLLRALEQSEGADAAEVHQLLGRVHRAVDNPVQALEHLRIAQRLQQPPPAELLRVSLMLQLELGEVSELAADARALLTREPQSPLGLAAAGIAQIAEDPEAALDLLARSLAAGETAAARLGLGLLRRQQGRPREALTALRAALRLRPESRRIRDELVQGYRDQLGLDETSEEADLYPTLRRLQLLLGSRPLLEEISLALTRIRNDFDRPLLVAVMGEFNSGKSTFVNALIGEEIAPMGVTPTTATINLLKYGEERGARVIWRDDREQQLSWEEVGPFLRALDQTRARAVRVVELLYPAEELLRVNVVDTPGLNSMIAEHEQTAREYLAQADAVIWLFSADQAGKQTEQQALETINRQRLKTVAVLNKLDHLDPTQLDQLTDHLRDGFGVLVEGLVAVSARRALQALISGDRQALEQSRFPELRHFLEERIFSRSRRIKREVAGQRLVQVIAAARERATAELAPVEVALQTVQQAIDEQRRVDLVAQRDVEQRQLRREADRVYLAAAEEVLDFVRPRRWFFGEHRATRADRDFLAELLEERLESVGQRSFDRVAGELGERGARLRATLSGALAGGTLQSLVAHLGELDQRLEQQLALLRQQVYARFTAFCRGFLRGGRVDHFFNVQLPGLALEADAVHRALTTQVVDLEAELITPLAEWLDATSRVLIRHLERLRDELALVALDLDVGLLQPLEELAAPLERAAETKR